MPEMGYEPRTTNDISALSDGWHPAYLVAITDEETPESWQMYKASPRMWKWHFAVWEVPTLIGQQTPEHQSAPTSQKFSPGGKFQPSKAYVWSCELLNRKIQAGERINLDSLMPLPCRVKVRRSDTNREYANIVDLERWPDGAQQLTPEIRQYLHEWLMQPRDTSTPPPQQQAPIPPPQSPAPQPGMQSWGNGAGPAAQPARSGWGTPAQTTGH